MPLRAKKAPLWTTPNKRTFFKAKPDVAEGPTDDVEMNEAAD